VSRTYFRSTFWSPNALMQAPIHSTYSSWSWIQTFDWEMQLLQDYTAKGFYLSEISTHCRVSAQMNFWFLQYYPPLFVWQDNLINMKIWTALFLADRAIYTIQTMGKQCRGKRGSWYPQGMEARNWCSSPLYWTICFCWFWIYSGHANAGRH
jgi:hypothetical protein